MRRVGGAWLDGDAAQSLLRTLEAGGHQAYAVGGCVRNALMGVPVTDLDVATDARPGRVTELAEARGWRVVPTGLEHGTVTVVIDGEGHEVTTFRRDVATDGRRAVIAFADRLEDDAARRDFTMNALYARADGSLTDPVGGLGDLAARRVRFIGRPEDRIREDFLRILRFFRFHALYGDAAEGLDPDGLAAAATHATGLERLSAERVGAEMRKLLAAPDPAPAVAAMAMTGVLAHALPGADPRALAPLVHLEAQAGLPPDPLRRLAALGGVDVETRLRLSRAETRRLEMLRELVASGAGVAADAYRHGAGAACDGAVLRAALTDQQLPSDLAGEAARGAEAPLPVSAADLMPGLSGAALGRGLAAAEAAWIRSDFSLDRAALIRAGTEAGQKAD
ncbi:MAG: CCA tRNA nucleotidyltransferase [Rhodobacteraceae bacterium]|nr:CCA tRNA nucleotidyltransferase [Paracoccaceae bacterium]